MLEKVNEIYPVRYTAFLASVVLLVFTLLGAGVTGLSGWWPVLFLFLSLVGLHDLKQEHHAILRNYPVIGHLRFMFEYIRPEIRQYFLESETDATPFSRAQRSLVYSRAKGDSDKRPFGTQLDIRAVGYEWINHSIATTQLQSHDFRIQIGGSACKQPYSMSRFNISAMSFGALSANAILALNLGAKRGGFAHDTGEGSISRHHRTHGGDLIWEIGSGYFGCRDASGHFSPEHFTENVKSEQVKMVEIKLSQGAKPGHGGVLPGPKVTPEIAQARGVPEGVDCVSPAAHSRFSTPLELMAFVQELRTLSQGKPVGMKLCIGHPWEWFGIVHAMLHTGIRPDFIVIDGAEGGTGAAPLEFSDHMGTPMQEGLRLVHNTLVGVGLREHIRLGASGKIISAFDVARTLALGADWCNAARSFMFALGCIQSRSCHTDECPTGVATQNALRQRGLDVADRANRVVNFHRATVQSLGELIGAAGLDSPAQLKAGSFMIRDDKGQPVPLSSIYPEIDHRVLLDPSHTGYVALPAIYRVAWEKSSADRFKGSAP